jgi:hypothetical protein
METPNATHTLLGKWDVYYHLPLDKNWELGSYKTIMKSLNTAEDAISLNENISEHTVKYSMLFVMRSGITPMWEDAKNRSGGCFSFKVLNKQVFEVWKALFYAACGETVFAKKEHNQHVNGITVSPKRNFCIVKVWMDCCDIQDVRELVDIPNMKKEGCIFKKHAPEF